MRTRAQIKARKKYPGGIGEFAPRIGLREVSGVKKEKLTPEEAISEEGRALLDFVKRASKEGATDEEVRALAPVAEVLRLILCNY